MSRTTARTAAMQMIFERVSGGQGGEETLQMVYDELREYGAAAETGRIGAGEPDEEDRAYIAQAFEGVMQHREELDDLIERTSKGWKLDQMSLVILSILRLAVWEIYYEPQVPDRVAIAEAVALTERYSGEEDKPFVNGILGTLQREKEARQ